MPTKSIVPETLIHANVDSAIKSVFRTMMGMSVTAQSSIAVPGGPPASTLVVGGPLAGTMAGTESGHAAAPHHEGPCVVGMVGFVGDINGFVYIYLELPFAVTCTAQMLGMDPLELSLNGEDTINDAVGELTNMVVGSFKNALCDVGFPCKLTIPSVLRARSFSIKSVKATRRFVYAFDCGGSRFLTDVLMHEE